MQNFQPNLTEMGQSAQSHSNAAAFQNLQAQNLAFGGAANHEMAANGSSSPGKRDNSVTSSKLITSLQL